MLGSRLDRAFVRYVQTGDPAALARVFDGCAAELYRIGYHLLGDRHAAEDLVQQTFVVAIEQAAQFDASRRVLPWLCGILTHRALHQRRQARARAAVPVRVLDVAVDPAATTAANEVAERIAASVRSLPEPYRQVLLLHLVHGLEPKEVAEALARPDPTVRTQLARGLERLRRLLPIGISGFAAGQVPPPVGLAAVRAAVVAHAAAHAPVAMAVAGVITSMGVVLMKKTLLVVAALLAVVSSFLWWGWDAPLPAPEAHEQSAPSAAAQSVPVVAPPSATEQVHRERAAEAGAPDAAGLDVWVTWFDGTPAADVAVRVRPQPLAVESWLRVEHTGADGVARFTGLRPGAANALTGRGANIDVDLVASTVQRATITLQEAIDVRGRVVDVDERPIAGATVWLSVTQMSDDGEPVATSAVDGTFAIRAVPAGHVVTATAPGLGCAREAWVEAGKPEIVLSLRPAPGVLAGTVVDPSGQPVAGARLLLGVTMVDGGGHRRIVGRIIGQDLWPSRFHRTDAEGRFRIEGLPALPWPLWVGAPGLAPWLGEVLIRPDAETQLAVGLVRGAVVRGRVTHVDGRPGAGATIAVYPDLIEPHQVIGLGTTRIAGPPLWARRSTTADGEGRYEVRLVRPGKVQLLAYDRGGNARAEHEVADGETFVWDAVVEGSAKADGTALHGLLVDEHGAPLPKWSLRVGEPHDPHNPTPIWVSDDGTFRTNRVTAGRHRLRVKPHAPMLGTEVDLGEFDVALCPLRLVLPPEHMPRARIRGRIVPPPAVPPTSCEVWVIPADTNGSVRVRCDEQGNYEAGPAMRGSYRLRVECPSFGDLAIGSVEVTGDGDADAGRFEVPTPGTLVVRAVDPAGRRIVDAWMRVRPIDDDRRRGGLEHRDGVARGNMLPGRWRVQSWDLTTMAAIEVEVRAGETTDVPLVLADAVPFVLRVPVARSGSLRLQWRDASGAVVRDDEEHPGDIVQNEPRKAPPGRYTLDVVDARGVKATTAFELVAGGPPLVVDLPLPGR